MNIVIVDLSITLHVIDLKNNDTKGLFKITTDFVFAEVDTQNY